MPYWTFLTKNGSVGYFWARALEKYFQIGNQHPRICLIVKILRKTKMTKFWTKNAWFGYFLPGF